MQPTLTVRDAFSNAITINELNPNGQATMANSQSVVLASDQTPLPVSSAPTTYSITQTVVTITATSQQLIAANSSRKYLSWMVIGTADVTITPGSAAAVVGAGQIFQSAGANRQGSSQEFPGAPTNAFQAIAALTGSTVVVWEGV